MIEGKRFLQVWRGSVSWRKTREMWLPSQLCHSQCDLYGLNSTYWYVDFTWCNPFLSRNDTQRRIPPLLHIGMARLKLRTYSRVVVPRTLEALNSHIPMQTGKVAETPFRSGAKHKVPKFRGCFMARFEEFISQLSLYLSTLLFTLGIFLVGATILRVATPCEFSMTRQISGLCREANHVR